MKKRNKNGNNPKRKNQQKKSVNPYKGIKLGWFQRLFMMFAIVKGVTTIKGKLGFQKTLKDGSMLINANAIYNALLLNEGGYFTVPFAGMAALLLDITNYTTSIANVKLRKLGAGGAKLAAKLTLYGQLEAALDYVNALARGNQKNAQEIIGSAKMVINGSTSQKKQDFSVRQGAGIGIVILSSLAVMFNDKYVKATYFWQNSLDNGVTWNDLGNSSESKFTAPEQSLGDVMYRKCTNSTKLGTTPWCKPITFNVK